MASSPPRRSGSGPLAGADARRARAPRPARADAPHDARRAAPSPTANSYCSPSRTARCGPDQIDGGRVLLDRALALRPARALRAAGGDRRAATEARDDWPQSRRSTTNSAALTGSPVVELTAPSRSPRPAPRGRARAGRRSSTRRLPLLPRDAADLLRRLGRADEARVAYERALELVHASRSAGSSRASRRAVGCLGARARARAGIPASPRARSRPRRDR